MHVASGWPARAGVCRYAANPAVLLVAVVASAVCAIVVGPSWTASILAKAQHFTVLLPQNVHTWEGFADSRTPYGVDNTVQIHLFNLTNAQSVLENGTMVDLQDATTLVTVRHKLARGMELVGNNDTVSFQPYMWYEKPLLSSNSREKALLTTVYVPMIVLFAHGFAPDVSAQVGIPYSPSMATDSRIGRLLTGACDGAFAQGDPSCAISELEKPHVETLRGQLAKARWLLVHTLNLLPAATWRVRDAHDGALVATPSAASRVRQAADHVQGHTAARPGGEPLAGGEAQGATVQSSDMYEGLDLNLLSSGTPDADVALLQAWPVLLQLHPLSVAFTAAARPAYAERPGLAKGWADMLFTQRTGEQVAWGYDDPLYFSLSELNSAFPDRYPGLVGNSSVGDTQEAKQTEKNVGAWHVGTGALSPSTPGGTDLKEWRGSAQVWCCSAGPCSAWERQNDGDAALAWAGPQANMVQGSFGYSTHANVRSSDVIQFWVDRLARPIPLSTDDAAPVSHGSELGQADPMDIPVLRFRPMQSTFLNAAAEPANAMFYSYGPTGLLNTSTCAPARLPLFHSLPYFLHGNASALNAVLGMPLGDEGDHDIEVRVEPLTGRVIEVKHRWQVNVWIAQQDGPPTPPAGSGGMGVSGGLWPNLRPLYLPLLWIDEQSSVGMGFRQAFAQSVAQPLQAARYLTIAASVSAGVCAVLMLLSLVTSLRSARKDAHVQVYSVLGGSMAESARAGLLAGALTRLTGRGRWLSARAQRTGSGTTGSSSLSSGSSMAAPLLGGAGEEGAGSSRGSSMAGIELPTGGVAGRGYSVASSGASSGTAGVGEDGVGGRPRSLRARGVSGAAAMEESVRSPLLAPFSSSSSAAPPSVAGQGGGRGGRTQSHVLLSMLGEDLKLLGFE